MYVTEAVDKIWDVVSRDDKLSTVQGTYINYILGHETNQNKCKRIEIIHSIAYDHNRLKM